MTPGKVNLNIVSQRATWIKEMIEALQELPVQNKQKFLSNKHTIAAAESYLRRSLEALFDIGRHILARRLGAPVTEYKEIAQSLLERKILQKNINPLFQTTSLKKTNLLLKQRTNHTKQNTKKTNNKKTNE